MDQMQNRRIAAVKAADAINAIEGVPVSDYAKTLSACWARGEICTARFSQKAGSNGAWPCLIFIYTRMFPS